MYGLLTHTFFLQLFCYCF